ncbi:MAG: alpha/beta fold hydrolase [Ilumatobacter sp.]|nr:alpha/beta fold hydrolase [Ilumatobacter sp.]
MARRPLIVAAVGAALVASCTTGSPDVVSERVESYGTDPGVSDPADVTLSTDAVGADPPAPGDEPIPPPVSDPPPPTLPPRPEPGTLDWSSCPQSTAASLFAFECATLRVPLDHDDPAGATIDIAVSRTRATGSDDERIGSLVINPGGPGGSGIDTLEPLSFLLSESITRRFDLVGFDPRGVAASTAIDCETELDDDVPFVVDDDKAAWDDVAADQAARLATCTAETTALAPYVGTNNVARDMDLLRAALGDERLTYLGYSYGTRLGATYAELFADNVRALVLDGGVKPSSSSVELDREQGGGFDRALENFAAACDADVDCQLGGTGPTLEVIDQLERDVVANGPLPTDLDGRVLTAGELQLGVASALYSKASWPYLATALAEAAAGRDGTLLQVLGDALIGRQPDGTYDNSTVARAFINCADDPERVSTAEQWERADAAADVSEYFGEFLRGSTGCLDIPPAIDPLAIGPAAGAPPIVVIGTTGDPATPFEWSVELAESLSSGVLYTVEAEGHTAYGSVDCVQAAIDAYLIDLTIPSTRSCTDDAGSDFFPPPGESELDQVLAFFDCLRDNGADMPDVSAADVLADPSLESVLDAIDLGSAPFQLALLACADLIPDI